jgi:hypothetical protein
MKTTKRKKKKEKRKGYQENERVLQDHQDH